MKSELLNTRQMVQKETYEFSTTQLVFNEDFNQKVHQFQSKIDPADVQKQTDPNIHQTILYGIKEVEPDERMNEVLEKAPIPKSVQLLGVDMFDSPEFDVLKIRTQSVEAENLFKAMSEAYPDNANTFPKYEGHITIQYLKKGTAQKYIDQWQNEFKQSLPVRCLQWARGEFKEEFTRKVISRSLKSSLLKKAIAPPKQFFVYLDPDAPDVYKELKSRYLKGLKGVSTSLDGISFSSSGLLLKMNGVQFIKANPKCHPVKYDSPEVFDNNMRVLKRIANCESNSWLIRKILEVDYHGTYWLRHYVTNQAREFVNKGPINSEQRLIDFIFQLQSSKDYELFLESVKPEEGLLARPIIIPKDTITILVETFMKRSVNAYKEEEEWFTPAQGMVIPEDTEVSIRSLHLYEYYNAFLKQGELSYIPYNRLKIVKYDIESLRQALSTGLRVSYGSIPVVVEDLNRYEEYIDEKIRAVETAPQSA